MAPWQVRMYSRTIAIIGGFLILASGAGELYRQKPRSRSLQSTGQVFLGIYLICQVWGEAGVSQDTGEGGDSPSASPPTLLQSCIQGGGWRNLGRVFATSATSPLPCVPPPSRLSSFTSSSAGSPPGAPPSRPPPPKPL